MQPQPRFTTCLEQLDNIKREFAAGSESVRTILSAFDSNEVLHLIDDLITDLREPFHEFEGEYDNSEESGPRRVQV